MKIRVFNIKLPCILFILIAAAVLRLYQIGQPFTDAHSWREASTAMMAENLYHHWNIFYPEINWDGPGPSYTGREFQTVTYLAAWLYVFFGQQDWIGRSIAVVFGVWGIFALYQLIWRVWDEQRALMGAAMMALLPGSIFVDREFLPDPAMVALITSGCWFLVAYLQTERLHYLVLAALASTLGCLTKLTGLSVMLPMSYAVFAILSSKERLYPKNLFPIAIAAAGSITIVTSYYLWARYLTITYPPHHFAGEQGFIWENSFVEWLRQKYFLPALYKQLTDIWTKPGLVLVLIGLLLLPALSARDSRMQRQLAERSGKAPWLFHWWLLGAGGLYYTIGASHLVDQPYNIHLFDPPAAALAGYTLVSISSFIKRATGLSHSWVIGAAVLLLIGGWGMKTLTDEYYNNPLNEESYTLALELRNITQPDDLVVTITHSIGNPEAIYYSHRHGWVFPPASTWSTLSDAWWSGIPDDGEAIQMLQELHAQGADWLGITNYEKMKIWKENPKLAAYIQRTFALYQESPAYIIYRIP
jgi:4-amino-4-deoxy-L-arabinose transferase-like glycosyltransferase